MYVLVYCRRDNHSVSVQGKHRRGAAAHANASMFLLLSLFLSSFLGSTSRSFTSRQQREKHHEPNDRNSNSSSDKPAGGRRDLLGFDREHRPSLPHSGYSHFNAADHFLSSRATQVFTVQNSHAVARRPQDEETGQRTARCRFRVSPPWPVRDRWWAWSRLRAEPAWRTRRTWQTWRWSKLRPRTDLRAEVG